MTYLYVPELPFVLLPEFDRYLVSVEYAFLNDIDREDTPLLEGEESSPPPSVSVPCPLSALSVSSDDTEHRMIVHSL